jgi:hypothetical protein
MQLWNSWSPSSLHTSKECCHSLYQVSHSHPSSWELQFQTCKSACGNVWWQGHTYTALLEDSRRARVADVALLRVVPTKDVVSNSLRGWLPVSTVGFHHSGSHHSGLSPTHRPHGCLGSKETSMAPNWARCILAALLLSRVWVSWIWVSAIQINDVKLEINILRFLRTCGSHHTKSGVLSKLFEAAYSETSTGFLSLRSTRRSQIVVPSFH